MKEVDRQKSLRPASRAGKWARTHALNLLGLAILDVPMKRPPKTGSSLAARLNPFRAGMEPEPEFDGRAA